MNKDKGKMLSASAVAKLYDVSHASVRAWCNQGLFPNAVRQETVAGFVWAIPDSDLKNFQPPKAGRPPKTKSSKKQ